jgi:hypothetical protein
MEKPMRSRLSLKFHAAGGARRMTCSPPPPNPAFAKPQKRPSDNDNRPYPTEWR